jgi:hypothetical protein
MIDTGNFLKMGTSQEMVTTSRLLDDRHHCFGGRSSYDLPVVTLSYELASLVGHSLSKGRIAQERLDSLGKLPSFRHQEVLLV